jgi:DNA helicase-2/ATP-dependent DNA helicase PcrA
MQLRPAQQAILTYRAGRMAVSAVPGSGKTFTLTQLATQLLAEGYERANPFLDPETDQQVLIVTYLNASVDTFKARIRQQLEERGLPTDRGFQVRTLHSLALEIIRLSEGGLSAEPSDPLVIDDLQKEEFLALALENWTHNNPEIWGSLLEDEGPGAAARWRSIILAIARDFIRAAKNERYRPHDILARLQAAPDDSFTEEPSFSPLLFLLAGVYEQYQGIVQQRGLDYEDLIWQAADFLDSRPDLAAELRRRWPYVLEDEAQDSVPLQETLLSALTGPDGNWVRVGDPNQSIMSTFTAAHPRFFNDFLDRPDVTVRPLPNSGRSAPKIIGAANTLVDWVIDNHPVPEVREHAFRRQHILPTLPGDTQPNPSDAEASIKISVYKHREDGELPAVATRAFEYTREYPAQTVAILTPTHQVGYQIAQHLDDLEAPYDNLLRGGTREREIAAALHAVLSALADPQDKKALSNAFVSLNELGHPAAAVPEDSISRMQTMLASVHQPERFLFPQDVAETSTALPAGVADEEELGWLTAFAAFMRELFALRPLPIDDLALALGNLLFIHDEAQEADLAIAYQIATTLRFWREAQPEWRLPELAAELGALASGRRKMPFARPSDYGYEPRPGRISLATQHGAKGLEWDAVFLVGIDGFWIPGSLEAQFLGVNQSLGGDPSAELLAQLAYLMEGDRGLYPGRSATETAHIEVIAERLRLLYVGITRARRFLHISRSRATGHANRERTAEPTTVLGVLYEYLKQLPKQDQ